MSPSEFEDGKLRRPIFHFWKQSAAVGEINRIKRDFHTSIHSPSIHPAESIIQYVRTYIHHDGVCWWIMNEFNILQIHACI